MRRLSGIHYFSLPNFLIYEEIFSFFFNNALIEGAIKGWGEVK
jgi:hypothetical protein